MEENTDSFKIIFLGTPAFAVASLAILVAHKLNVVAVITAPDKPAGRGQVLQQSEVKQFALAHGIPVFQPEKLSDPMFLGQIKSFDADLQVVVAFRMMPEKLWNMPRLGTFNLHASLLPQYRGAAPINHAIINGEKKTGVTTFFLKHEIDTGDILFREELPIGANETAGELHDRLMVAGATLVLKTTLHIISGDYKTEPQPQLLSEKVLLKTAPKIFKNDCRINWDSDVITVHNLVRGLSPYPTAWTEISDPNGVVYPVKIYKTAPEPMEALSTPGFIKLSEKKELLIACRDGYLKILEMQLPGKRRMQTGELLRGFQLDEKWMTK